MTHNKTWTLAVLLTAIALIGINYPAIASPQSQGLAGESITGSTGITETTGQIMARQAQRAGFAQEQIIIPLKKVIPPNKTKQSALTQGPVSGPASPQAPAVAFTLGKGFEGPSTTTPCATPPDTMGTVGPSQFIVFVNCNIVSYNKTTGVADGVLNTTPDNFFLSVRSNTASDPHIRYDRLTQRWFMVIIDVTFPNNRVLLAVSDSATITVSTNWTFFFFQSANGAHTNCLADYPTPGIDANAIYIGVNQYCGSSLGSAQYTASDGYVVQKSSVLGAGPIHYTAFANLATPLDGPATPQGVDNPDPSATEGYFIGTGNCCWNEIDLRRVSNPGSLSPSIGGIVRIATANQGIPTNQPHLGNTQGTTGYLDASDNRLFAAYFRNGSLWTAMDVGVTVSGLTCSGTAALNGANRDAVFWWEIRGIPTGATPTVFQSGSVCDTSASNPAFFSYGTIAVNGQGHAAMGYTVAGAANYTEPGISARLASDPLGMLPTSYISPTGSHPYNPFFDTGSVNGFRRWGDFSYTSADPCDDMTLWTIQEYASQNNAYGERVTQLIAPLPATPASTNPSAVLAGQANTDVIVTGTSINGSGFYDTPPSMSAEPCRKRIGATVSGGVTVNSVTYTDPTHVTLNISTVGVTLGTKTVTITNPDGQSSSAAILQVTGGLTSTITTLTSAPDASTFGQPVTITATVSASGGTPSGTVLFFDNGTLLGSPSLASGKATLTTSALLVGTHPITGTYSGDSSFAASTSTILSQGVNKADTTVLLTSSSNSIPLGQIVTFTATVSSGGGIPTGNVQFKSDSTNLGSTIALSNGTATLITSALPLGAHTITADYVGSSNYNGNTSNSVMVAVQLFQYLPFIIR